VKFSKGRTVLAKAEMNRDSGDAGRWQRVDPTNAACQANLSKDLRRLTIFFIFLFSPLVFLFSSAFFFYLTFLLPVSSFDFFPPIVYWFGASVVSRVCMLYESQSGARATDSAGL
jgi:hypothetical protein